MIIGIVDRIKWINKLEIVIKDFKTWLNNIKKEELH